MESYLLRGHPSGDTLLVGDGGGVSHFLGS